MKALETIIERERNMMMRAALARLLSDMPSSVVASQISVAISDRSDEWTAEDVRVMQRTIHDLAWGFA